MLPYQVELEFPYGPFNYIITDEGTEREILNELLKETRIEACVNVGLLRVN